MVKITDLGQRQKSAQNAERTTGLSSQNFTGAFFMLFFINKNTKMQGLFGVKMALNFKKLKGNFLLRNLKI